MRKIKSGVAKRLIFSLCVLGALGGCAVYPTSPGYVGPPVYFGVGIWGGGYHHYHGGRGWHGGWHGGGHWRR